MYLFACALGVLEVDASTQTKVQTKARTYVGYAHATNIEINYAEKGDYIKNLKSENSNLVVMETSRKYDDDDENNGTITLYAKKAGTYKFSFDVYSKNDEKQSHHTVVVYATKYTGSWKIGNTYVLQNHLKNNIWCDAAGTPYYYTSKKSAKIQYVAPKGCKLIKIEMSYWNGKKTVTKKITNGKKINFNVKNADSVIATTGFTVTYKDTYTGNIEYDSIYVRCPVK